MEISALASGSSGNCFFVENPNNRESVLIDCGISCKQVCERLDLIGKSAENVKGIFVTHEHSDHLKGCDVFARKFNVPIYVTKKTASEKFICSNPDLVIPINNNETIPISGLNVSSFSKNHKAIDPVSFSVFNNLGKTVSVITDIGFACENVKNAILNSDALFIESNYDHEMLENGHYPYFLKKWITSDIGHISNTDSSDCLNVYAKKRLKNVILSHLSENNNTSELALNEFKKLVGVNNCFNSKLFVSEKFKPTNLISV